MNLNFTTKGEGHTFSISEYTDSISLTDINDSDSVSFSFLFILFLFLMSIMPFIQLTKSFPRVQGHPGFVGEICAANGWEISQNPWALFSKSKLPVPFIASS